jgi:hypothetical protein
MINAKDYGARGDGISLDTAAVSTAASKALASGEPLYFPGGVYLLDSQFQLMGKSLSILGDGKALTRLLWTSKSGGIHFTGSGGSANDLTVFSMEKITLATMVTAGGTALHLQWPTMNANPLKKTRISDLEIRGWDQYAANPRHAWEYGIRVLNPGGLDISHTDVLGLQTVMLVGIQCGGDFDAGAIRHFLSNIYVLRPNVGIEFDGGNEGVYLNNFELVGCGVGFHAVGGGPVYHISNGHTDCRTTGLLFKDKNEVKLHNIALFHTSNGGPRTSGNLIQMENCKRFMVSNCSFYGFKKPSDPPHQNGILANDCTSGIILGNQFDQIVDTAILFGEGTSDCHSVANRISNCGTPYVNKGAASNTYDLGF